MIGIKRNASFQPFISKIVRCKVASKHNRTGTSTAREMSDTPILSILVVFHFATLVLHLIVQYTIYKANLKNNQYFLVRLLSGMDMVVPALGLVIISFELAGFNHIISQGALVISILKFLFHLLSINITLIIAVDRFIAVKYALRYNALVTKRRLVYAILSCGFVNIVVLCCLLFIVGYSEVAENSVLVSNTGVWIYISCMGLLTCVTIFILGKITKALRDGNEKRIQDLNNIHGNNAEELDLVKKLKQTIKDMIKLNFWTCISLIPLSISSLIIAFGSDVQKTALVANIIFAKIYALLNPIIYLTSFEKIREYWARRSATVGDQD